MGDAAFTQSSWHLPARSFVRDVGPTAGSAKDLAAMMNVLGGFDAQDPTSLKAPVPNYLSEIDRSVAGLRVGVDRRWVEHDVHPDVVRAVQGVIDDLRSLDTQIVEIEFPEHEHVFAPFATMLAAEAANVHRDMFAARAEQYGPLISGMVRGGLKIKAVDYVAATQLRPAFREAVTNLFANVDVLIAPVMADCTPTVQDFEASLGDNLRRSSRYTVPFNMSGHPSLTIPAGFCSRGLPIGVQLLGPELGEERLLRLGHRYQQLHPRVDPPLP